MKSLQKNLTQKQLKTKKLINKQINPATEVVKIEYKNIFDVEINWKTVSLFAFLAIFPNVLGLFHTTIFGVKIHFFQYLIFLAAAIYGPLGGLVSGAFGSIWIASALHNPYIVVGNMILGFFVGFFFKRNFNLIIAVLLAYLIQIPWLWVTDIYFAGMPVAVVKGVVIGLFVSNMVFALITMATWKKIKQAVV